jgi:hypothetical protein
MNSTVTVLYEDRVIDPHIPSNCKTFYRPTIDKAKEVPYFQQLWGLSECFDLVKDYEEKMNIRYELLIRSRPDSLLDKVPESLQPPNNSTILIPDENHFGGYNDRFAIGHISPMEKYMRRWNNISACHIQNLHAETFLKLFLHHFGVHVQLMKNISYAEKSHGQDRCH